VIAVRVNHQAGEHALHLALDLVEQGFELARFDELGDVVVGMKAALGQLDALPDPHGHGCADVGIGFAGAVGRGRQGGVHGTQGGRTHEQAFDRARGLKVSAAS